MTRRDFVITLLGAIGLLVGAYWLVHVATGHRGGVADCATRLAIAEIEKAKALEELWLLEEEKLGPWPEGLECPCSPELGEDD